MTLGELELRNNFSRLEIWLELALRLDSTKRLRL